MPRGRKGHISQPVKLFIARFMRENEGQRPTLGDVLKAHPELEEHKHAVTKVLQRTRDKGPAELAPVIPEAFRPSTVTKLDYAPTTLRGRLEKVRELLANLEEQAQAGRVDASGYDRLTRLERDLMGWIRTEEAEAQEARDKREGPEGVGAVETIMQRYRERKAMGLNAKKTA